MDEKTSFDTEAWVYREWPSKRPRWRIGMRFNLIDGQVRCTGLQVLNQDAQDPFFNAAALRRLPIAAMIKDELRLPGEDLSKLMGLARMYRLSELSQFGAGPKRKAGPNEEYGSPTRGRPRKYSREHYEQVAMVYLENTVAPTAAVARIFKVNRTTAANWVRKARELHLLPVDPPGRSERKS